MSGPRTTGQFETTRITVREARAALLGGTAVLAVMVTAQFLGRQDNAREAEKLRAQSAVHGFDEGLKRVQCMGGIRYDSATGRAIDIDDAFHVKQNHQ